MRLLASIAIVVSAAAALAGTSLANRVDQRAGVDGISVVLPATWHSIQQASGSATTAEPATRFVVASGPIGFGRGCNDLDYSFGARDVAIVAVEWVGATPGVRWATRPPRFDGKSLPVRREMLECFKGTGGGVQFSERERRLAVYLLVGRHAPATLVARARAVLETLAVEPRPLPKVDFTTLPAGWRQYRDTRGALALSWHNRYGSEGWAVSMPRDAIAVQVLFVRQPSRYAPLRLVLPRTPTVTLEGAPDTPEFRIRGSVRGHDVEIWIDIRRPHPTAQQRRVAQRVVSGIRF